MVELLRKFREGAGEPSDGRRWGVWVNLANAAGNIHFWGAFAGLLCKLPARLRAEPLWGHHSFRRFADTVARETMALTGATEQDIDLYFGWMENFYNQKMQVHYQSRFDRTRRTAVTSLA